MVDADLTTLGGFTPILTDITYGVDDPAGTKTPGKLTLQNILTLYLGTANTWTADQRFNGEFTVNSAPVAGKTVAITIPDDTANEGVLIQNTDGSVSIINLSGVAGEFQPRIVMTPNGKEASILAEIPVVDDAGTTASLILTSRNNLVIIMLL